MAWYLAFLPTLIICFGASFLFNIFKDQMSDINRQGDEIAQVEVINPHDFRR